MSGILKAMIGVGIVGVELAVFRWLLIDNIMPLIRAGLITVALQVGLWFLFRGSSRFRWFWLGFVLTATVWFGVFGLLIIAPQHSDYDRFWIERFHQWTVDTSFAKVDTFIENEIGYGPTTFAVMHFVPQFLIALVSGFLTHWVVRLITFLVAKRRAGQAIHGFTRLSSNASGARQ